jgi:hypothetical protein
MAKITTYITIVWMVSSFVRCQPVIGDRNISYNVVQRDTIVEITETIDTVFEKINIRQAVIDTLIYYVGVKELTGNNDGVEVEMFIESTGLNPKGGYDWCAAFITYGFKVNDLPVPKYPARAASWFDEEHTIPNEQAIEGDLASFYYKKLGRIGHIASYTKPYVNPTPYCSTVEGNTNAKGSREGNQVAAKLRLRATIHSSADWIGKEV